MTYIGVWFVTLNLAFFIPRFAPGNAADILAGSGKLPQETVKLLTVEFGLNQSLFTQYILFLKGTLLTFPPNFGFSFQYFPNSVSSIILQRLPASIFLMAVSFALAIAISYGAAVLSSQRRGGKFELGALYSSLLFHATPVFWTALILLWIFGVDLKLFPIYGIISATVTGGLDSIISLLWHSILPIAAMTSAIFGQIYLLLRGSTQQILKSDYVTAAKTRGLKDRIVATRYILRNSLLPVVSLLAFSLGSLVSISVLIESVFGFAGVGDLFVDAVFNRDYPVLEGGFFYVTLFVIIGGLIGDIILARLDPRIRQGVTS